MNLENVSSRTSRNGRNVLLYGKVVPEDEVIAKIRAVTIDEIKETASMMLDLSKISLCVAGKTASEKTYKEILQGSNKND